MFDDSKEQFNHVEHDSNPIQTMTLTTCPAGRGCFVKGWYTYPNLT